MSISSGTSEESATAEARRLGRSVEVESETSATNSVVANPNGTFTLTSHREPVRVRRDSVWVPVDTTLRFNADGSVAPVATDQPITFSGGGTSPMVTIGKTGRSISLRWPAALPTPSLSGSSATYPNVLPGVDLVVNAQAESFTQVLVVKDATAAGNPALSALKLNAETDGLQLTAAADGAMTAADETGATVFTGPPPTMWDSTLDQRLGGKPSAQDPGSGRVNHVPARLTQIATARAGAAKRYEIALAPPTGALRGPDVKYPLFVDPPFTGAKINFAVVRSNGSTLYNTTDELKTGYCGWSGCNGTGTYRSYFDLNVSAISGRTTTAEIYGATLNVLATHNAHNCTGEVVRLYSANSITTKPAWPGPAVAHLATSSPFNYGGGSACPANWTRWGGTYMTNKIQQAADGDWKTVTFGLLPDTGDANEWKNFANNPNITITYAFPPSQATALTITSPITCSGLVHTTNNRPTLNAKASDYNPSPLTLKHHFHVYRASDNVRVTSGSDEAATNTTAQWTVPSALPDGNYYFMVNVESLAGLTPNQISFGTAKYAFAIQSGTINATPTFASFDYPRSSETEVLWGAPAGQGKIDVSANGAPNVVGIAYSWVDANAVQSVPTTTCAYSSTYKTDDGISAGGWIPVTGGTASIPVPTDMPKGPRTLHVKSFNDAHRMSGVASYSFMIAPTIAGKPASRLEIENVASTGGITQPTGQSVATYKEGPSSFYWANGYQQHFVTTAPNQKFDIAFTVSSDAKYALGAAVTQANHYGILRFSVDGVPLTTYDPVNEETQELRFDGYNPGSRASYANLGEVTLAAGSHVMAVEVVGKNPASVPYIDKGTGTDINDNGFAFGLDYLRLTPLQ